MYTYILNFLKFIVSLQCFAWIEKLPQDHVAWQGRGSDSGCTFLGSWPSPPKARSGNILCKLPLIDLGARIQCRNLYFLLNKCKVSELDLFPHYILLTRFMITIYLQRPSMQYNHCIYIHLCPLFEPLQYTWSCSLE